MNMLQRLEERYRISGDTTIRDAADSLALEQLLADKLYRALLMSLGGSKNETNQRIIDEALIYYETCRMYEVHDE